MIDLPEGPTTIRQRIMSVLLARFENQRRGVDGAILTWSVVSDKPLNADQQRQDYTLGIYDTSEKKKDIVNATECFLNIVMEFGVNVAEGDDMQLVLRAMLGEVQRVAMLDLNNKEPDGFQLSVNTSEKGNELENVGEKAMRGSGVVVFEVHYRTKPGKPSERR